MKAYFQVNMNGLWVRLPCIHCVIELSTVEAVHLQQLERYFLAQCRKRVDKGAHEILATFETLFVRSFISRVET